MHILLPQADGTIKDYRLRAEPVCPTGPVMPFNRTVYAAAHVVINPQATPDPWDGPVQVDWERTMAFREHLYGLGFKVAEAMDTAQRGMGIDWPTARELIQRSLRHARTCGGDLACGAGTDQLAAGPDVTLAQVEAAYREQLEIIEGGGGRVILMASRALAQAARGPDDYLKLYGRLLQETSQPVVLHWLGEMFDPGLRGYWGSTDIAQALDTVLQLIGDNAARIEGIKVSLLEAKWEIELRRRLPAGVKMYTGDDFNYAELMAGDAHGYSHGLLGIFDPIAPVAALALRALASGNTFRYRALLDPTVALSREIFRAPTRHYKAGVVFLAWLNGHQDHFAMAGGLQSARGVAHYARVFELADACGVLSDPELATLRMKRYLFLAAGIGPRGSDRAMQAPDFQATQAAGYAAAANRAPSPQISLLIDLFKAAVGAADPMQVLPPQLPAPPRGRTVVVGIGKAAAAMARAVEAHWAGPLTGVVVVPDGAKLPTRHIEVLEASHPVPDERSVGAARRLMSAVEGLCADDLVIALVSGGGSSLCAWPAEGLTLADKQDITRGLLRGGATIAEINTVRRHLSRTKGGRLAAHAYPAQVVSLLISDVPGDDPAQVASGPTLADSTTCADALAILQRHRLAAHPAVRSALSSGNWESIKGNDVRLAGHQHRLIASAWTGLAAAAARARAAGWACHILSDAMEGEAREHGATHAAMALSVAQRGAPFTAPCVILSGGEATVTVRGSGRGGRNTELALAMALALEGRAGSARVHALSAGTDGLDGQAGAAGAWLTPTTLARSRALGLDPLAHLDNNDSATVFEAVKSLLLTGPTHTNINDFRAILVEVA